MMAAKARGKNQTVLYDDGPTERPAAGATAVARDVRSIAHLKMLQSLAGKLNRLNDVQQIGQTIATELRLLIDYHNCRVVLRDGDQLRPITFVGEYDSSVHSAADAYTQRVGVGITGRVAETGESLLVPNALECEFGFRIPGTAGDRGVARARAAALRLAGDRRDRDLEARPEPVRRGRRPPARGALRPGLRRARERTTLRAAAARGRGREGAARLRGRGLAGAHRRGDLRAHGRDRGVAVRDRRRVALARRHLCRERRPAARRGHVLPGSPRATGSRAAWCSPRRRSTKTASGCWRRSPTRRRSRCRRRASTASSSRPRRSPTRCSRRAASSRRRRRPTTCWQRSVEVTARVLGTERAALWIQEDAAPGDLVARASNGYRAGASTRREAARFPGKLAREWLEGRTEPFVLEPEVVAHIDGVDDGAGRSLRGRSAAARRQPRRCAHRRRPAIAISTTGSFACSTASPTRRSWRSRAPRTSRASSRRSCRRSRRSRTRSRRTTRMRRPTPAGSPTWRCSSAASCASTGTR